MTGWSTVATDALLLAGTAATTLAIIGIIRLPDTLAKLHAAATVLVPGVLVILASAVPDGRPEIIARSILVSAFLLLTTPVAAHALGRAEEASRERET